MEPLELRVDTCRESWTLWRRLVISGTSDAFSINLTIKIQPDFA